jgi:trans-2,3-dihydro-3-hydroxyanthranilate isomerase
MGPQRRLWMRVPAPDFGKTYEPAPLAGILGLATADIDPRFPIQAVATGLPTIIVPLRSQDAVTRCAVDVAALDDLLGRTRARLAGEMLLVFSTETHDPANELRVRVFAHRYGAAEDPGTGSANGALAAWLAAQRYLGRPDIGCQVEQGLEMGQACRLHLRTELTNDGIQVSVGGHVELGEPGVWPD